MPQNSTITPLHERLLERPLATILALMAVFGKILDFIVKPRSAKTEALILLPIITLTIIAAIATALVMLNVGDIRQDSYLILLLLFSDFILLFALVIVVIRNIFRFRFRNRSLKIGSHFRSRLVLIFALFSAVPSITLTVFSLLFLDFGLDNWFSEKVKTSVQESKAVASAYLEEHAESIRFDALLLARSVAADLQRSGDLRQAGAILYNQARFRDLSEAIIFRRNGEILARYGLTFDMEFEVIPQWAFAEARRGDVPLIRNADERRIRALALLDPVYGTYMLVGRTIDPQVLSHVETTEATVAEYEDLELTRINLQISFIAGFVFISLLLLLLAVLLGVQFASGIWKVLENLLTATSQVGQGKFEPVEFPKRPENDEIEVLNNAFNDMVLQLGQQRQELLDASEQIDQRRRFSEAVLSGVNAGVISLDAKGKIELINRRAETLLGISFADCKAKKITKTVPDFAHLFSQAENLAPYVGSHKSTPLHVEERVHFESDSYTKEFFVRIGLEINEKRKIVGYVVTFDDLTDLLAAQRQAAWADIARRIAHEVKNPLTPIQLSAERLRRKYAEVIGKQSQKDKEIFDDCIATIVRQVRDIGALVNEFSDFARMPQAVTAIHDINEICQDTVFLERSRAVGEIDISFDGPAEPLHAPVDRRQLSQALINLIKNAIESIKATENNRKNKKGKVAVNLQKDDNYFHIRVADNGPGFSALGKDWTQPYVTEKLEGSGLGLSIVKKIVEDHGGYLKLENAKGGGAVVTMILPLKAAPVTDNDGAA